MIVCAFYAIDKLMAETLKYQRVVCWNIAKKSDSIFDDLLGKTQTKSIIEYIPKNVYADIADCFIGQIVVLHVEILNYLYWVCTRLFILRFD
jgi:hypothetical protein